MREVPIFPHVMEAGARCLRSGLDAHQPDAAIALAIYLAMDELLHVTFLAAGEELH